MLLSQSALRRVFIDELIKSSITLVHNGECPESTVTPEEAGSFFYDAVHIAPSAPPTAVNDQEAEDLVSLLISVQLLDHFYINRSTICNHRDNDEQCIQSRFLYASEAPPWSHLNLCGSLPKPAS